MRAMHLGVHQPGGDSRICHLADLASLRQASGLDGRAAYKARKDCGSQLEMHDTQPAKMPSNLAGGQNQSDRIRGHISEVQKRVLAGNKPT